MNGLTRTAALSRLVVLVALAVRIPSAQGSDMPETDPGAGEPVTNWLACGFFPSPAPADRSDLEGETVGAGFDRDFLKEAGGEFGARPRAGMSIKRPDGTEAGWEPWLAPRGVLDATAGVLKGQQPRGGVAYFFTTINGATDAKLYIDVAGAGNAKLFLNGYQILRRRMRQGASEYRELLPVCPRQGDSSLLCKADTPDGAWKMSVRLVDGKAMAADYDYPEPAIGRSASRDQVLNVMTDTRKRADAAALPKMKVEAVAPGGKTMASLAAAWGDSAPFHTAAWPDGPYEFRVSWPARTGGRGFVYLPWYKGDWRKAARQLIADEAAPGPAADEPSDLVMRLLAEWMTDKLGAGAAAGSGKDRGIPAAIHGILMERGSLKAGYLSNAVPNGFARLAWRDDVDGSPQYARVYFPPDYDNKNRGRGWPLVVNLHGSDFSYPKYIHWWGADQRHHWTADRQGVIVLEPHGRGMTSFEGIGEQDVLRAISKAKTAFRIDDDRVYLMGISMGGHGTYSVGTRHPELFAALASICGGGGFFHVFMDDKQIEAMTPRERFRAEGRSAWVQADALLHTPIFIAHGDKDTSVTVEYSRFIVKLLQAWGYDVRYWEHPGKGHGDLGAVEDVVRWLLEHKRDRSPARVMVRSARLDSAKAHWVSVRQREDPYSFVNVDAHMTGKGRLLVDSENVLDMELTPPPEFLAAGGAAAVVWNGRDVGSLAANGGRIILRSKSYSPGKRVKTPGIEGPISDVANTPHAIVVGTISGDERMRMFCRRRADILRRAWVNWQRVEPRMFLDTEVTDKIIGQYSLKLVGGPNENAVTRKLAGGIPLELKPDRIVVAGCKFPCTNAAVSLVYPNPANPERYVSIVAGNSANGMYLGDYLWDGDDFVIEDERGCVAAGRFDCNWRVNEAYVDRTDPAKRAGISSLRGVPAYVKAPAGQPRLALGDLLEIQASDVFRRNTNWQGEPISLGGRTFDSGLSVGIWQSPHSATFDISAGKWTRLKATIGIEWPKTGRDPDEPARQASQARFAVVGDGKTLYESPVFQWNSAAAELDVGIRGVTMLELRTSVPGKWLNAISSLDWADIRIEE